MTERRRHADPQPPGVAESVEIGRFDLQMLALMTSVRLADEDAEAWRATLLDEVHRAGLDAHRLLGVFVRHAITESRGSHSTWNVGADADAYFRALATYSAAVRRATEQLLALAP